MSKQKLFEMMGKLNPDFNPLNENFSAFGLDKFDQMISDFEKRLPLINRYEKRLAIDNPRHKRITYTIQKTVEDSSMFYDDEIIKLKYFNIESVIFMDLYFNTTTDANIFYIGVNNKIFFDPEITDQLTQRIMITANQLMSGKMSHTEEILVDEDETIDIKKDKIENGFNMINKCILEFDDYLDEHYKINLY